MSEGAPERPARRWDKQIKIAVLLLAIAYGFGFPAGQYLHCSRGQQSEDEAPGTISIQSESIQTESERSERPSIGIFPLDESLVAPHSGEASAYGTYHAPHKPYFWGRTFVCAATVSDYLMGLFTLVLAIVTGFLWLETERLAKGAEEQARDSKTAIAASEKAANAATSAAAAASEQVRIARTALMDTERAFVFCERTIATHLMDKKTETILEWRFQPIWRNAGKTPTRRAVNSANHWIGQGVGPLPSNFDFPDYAPGSATMIGPKATMHTGPIVLTLDQANEIRAGRTHAYVWGWIDYDDIFEDSPRHRSEFCFEIIVTGNPAYPPEPFAYRMHGPFNGYDGDCFRAPTPYEKECEQRRSRTPTSRKSNAQRRL